MFITLLAYMIIWKYHKTPKNNLISRRVNFWSSYMRRQLEEGSYADLAFFVGKLRSENRILYVKCDLEETISWEYQYDF